VEVEMLFAIEKQLGLYRKRIEENSSSLIPITTCSASYLALDPSSLPAC
jgi:hypothetical protein